MAGQLWMKWWVGSWQQDPAVAQLSAEARGVWLELICVMHQLDAAEVSGTPRELARMTRLDTDEVERGLEQIERFGAADVTRCNGNVTVVSRRRQRDIESRISGRERVKRYREKQADSGDEPECNADVTLTHARARASSSLSSSSSSSEREESLRGEETDGVTFDEAWQLYAYKVGKQAALKAWSKLKAPERSQALSAIPAYVAATDPDGAGGMTRRAHFATWLNGRRWEDEHTPKPNHGKAAERLTARQTAELSLEERIRRAGWNDR